MPKAKWGAGENMLTAADIEGAEVQENNRYSGELPRPGTYRFTIRSLKKGVANSGNEKVTLFATLDGDWKDNHKKYDGAPVFHHLALSKNNASNVKNFLDSIGATAHDLLEASIIDDNEFITKLGRVGDPVGLQVYITVKHSKPTTEYPDPSLNVAYNGYNLVEAEDDAEPAGDVDPDGADADGAGDEPPF